MERCEKDFKAFAIGIKKSCEPKTHKIAHCLGSRDAWKWVRKNKWKALGGEPFDQLLYSKIINAVNQNIVELVLEGKDVEFPHSMGRLRLIKEKKDVYISDGKVKTTYMKDWDKTLRMWFEDEEEREAHTVIRRVRPYSFKIAHIKDRTAFPNKHFYHFRANRKLNKRLGEMSEWYNINTVELEQ